MRGFIQIGILLAFLIFAAVETNCQQSVYGETFTVSGHVYPLDAPSNTLVHRQVVRVIVSQIDNGYTSYVGTVQVNASGYYSVSLPAYRLYVVVPSIPQKALSRYSNAIAIFDNDPAYIFNNLQQDQPDSDFELTIIQFAFTRDGAVL